MIWRLTLGVLCLLFAAEEFVRTGPAAAEVVRHPGRSSWTPCSPATAAPGHGCSPRTVSS